jgi:hypothetical protein
MSNVAGVLRERFVYLRNNATGPYKTEHAEAGKRDRVGEEPNVHGVKYAAAVQPNAKLLRLGRQRQRVASLPHLATNSPSALIPTSLTGTSATLVTSDR